MTSLNLTTIILALIVGMAGAAMGETAQERVARRVAEKYPAKVEEKLPYGINIIAIRGCEYFQWDTGYGKGLTHLGNCTNHVPVTVTQYVDRVVTQECQRQHWPEPGQAIHEPCNGVYCEQCRPHGGIWGISPVPNDWVMGTNGFMAPPGSPEAWQSNHNWSTPYYTNMIVTNNCIGSGVANRIAVEGVNVEAGE